MDIIRLYQDYSINFLTEGHKHCRPGWVNTPCPFCTCNPGYHLGYELEENYYYCWRCGWHPVIETLSKLLHINERSVRKIISNYGLLIPKARKVKEIKVRMKNYRMPSNTGPLETPHIKYLESRGFDAKHVQHVWKLMGTGPMSLLDRLDYKLRIIAPIIWDSKAVSFVGRDITNKQKLRYKACPEDRELIHHKHILYGKQDEWSDTAICVEGPTDVWRFGVNSFSTFGIQYTIEQVRVITKTFKKVWVCFDRESQAQKQASQLVADLRIRGVNAKSVIIPSGNDPGDMEQSEANYFVKQLIK